MHVLVVALLLSVVMATLASAILPPDSTPLNRWTAIMTHNSATGKDNSHVSYCDNQGSRTIAEQLDCGARALDYRPRLDSASGTVFANHGVYCDVNVPMATSVQSVIDWLGRNPGELVVMYLSHFLGTIDVGQQTVRDAAAAVLRLKGVSTIRDTKCGQLAGLTIGGVKERSALPNGGYLLAVYDGACMDEQYTADVNYNEWTNYDWYMESLTNFPNADHARSGKLYMVQALWQQEGIINIVGEEQMSNLNNYTKSMVESGAYYFTNFIEVNNVCNNGPALKSAIDAYFNTLRVSNCLRSNMQLAPGRYIQSNNGLHRAVLGEDGKFCMYSRSDVSGVFVMTDPVWCNEERTESGPGGTAPASEGGPGVLQMQADGNLVLYTPTKYYY